MTRLDWLDAIDSTQDELLRRIAAAQASGGTTAAPAHGDAVATADQRAGRGRHGRVWTAPAGSALALSVVLRPGTAAGPLAPVHFSWVSLVAAAAVADRLEALGVDVHVKWPNDVLAVDGCKLCGVLATLAPDGALVVGMGVNLDHSAGAPAPTATALGDWIGADRVPAPRPLAEELLAAVVAAVDAFAAGVAGESAPVDGAHPALAPVARRLSTLGRAVRAELPGGEVLEGTATGLGPGGTLLVSTLTDTRETLEREVSAGDVVHLRGDVRRGR